MNTDDDYNTIRAFANWITDDIMLPIDPDNYQQMKTALAWAFRERQRRRINTVHENDTFWINDSDYLQRFIEALRLRIEEMEDRDRAKLAAWNRGESIR